MQAIRETVVHTRISHLQLWLEILIILSTWPVPGHAQHTNLPEVMIPLRVRGNRTMQAMGWLIYSLHFEGQRHLIYMKAKKFSMSRHLSVFTYTEQGALHQDQPFVQNNCYYHGYVDGDAESIVALTTCLGGFRGILQINGTVYEVKPKNLSSTFEHLVYKMGSEETQLRPMRCALTEEEIARQRKLQENDNPTLMQSNYEGWWTHKRFLNLALVVDHERILYLNGNLSLVLLEILMIVDMINMIYRPLDLEVVLPGVEMWNEGNQVTATSIDGFLTYFCSWKTVVLNNRIPNDIAHLFVRYDFGIYLGLAYVGTVCVPSLNCGVDSLIGSDIFQFGLIIAHEMGHNLGMSHDNDYCTCGKEACLMAEANSGIYKFSNCSFAEFWPAYAAVNCMHKEKKPVSQHKLKVCGNGVVDDGEQCDCGSSEMCKNDPCCMRGCTLRAGASCAFGLCCKHCQIMPSATVCRVQDNECDLPEWCDGHSHECPNDVYLLDGSSCKDGGYCYEKRCHNRDEQCRQIFGKEARSATQRCYREINSQGDRFGNCGIFRGAYIRCNDPDILCGRVQCENVQVVPLMKAHSTVHWTYLNGVTCWGTDYHWGMTIPDNGHVKDGTECGPGHVCMNRKCVSKLIWVSDCSPETCNLKGVCNNLHHCHCNLGWDPPFCLSRGYGGSVDSGPPYKELEKPKKNYWKLIILVLFVTASFSVLIWLCSKYAISPRSEKASVSTSEEDKTSSDVSTASKSS
ncbi:disintegrin and metalloproteinase domain-containing protein 25-like isoform X1 [Alexandromys fortis]|uniref:disintegrin and metalloproteinase domain-containing protein 25-like isoform X1 n=1 Tax=Alexandromys fortis TaxID=100897 RepID=UPI0021522273|nr:disintegrin and metalloproteinase domain-containing protein 25-like isoform X1 [Microtus fortis]XP_050003353.1 disintegrin and metalloproteinase domain-containing protein 25-like isoform X1 [Microtus fortis]